jgi:hypothetical protein
LKKRLGRLVILGAVVGGIVAVGGYLRGAARPQDVAQVTFDDGSTRAFASNTPEGEEFADIARKLVEMGL